MEAQVIIPYGEIRKGPNCSCIAHQTEICSKRIIIFAKNSVYVGIWIEQDVGMILGI